MTPRLVLLSGNAHRTLSEKISNHLDIPLADATVTAFADGESRVELHTNVRGSDVFLIQSTCPPVNHTIMEALVMVDACRRASANTITLVCPYFGYARQERKSASRTPITAKLVAELYEVAGVDRMVALELHNSAIQGFFNIPMDHLFIKPVFYEYFKHMNPDETVVISPDAGGVERARAMAKQLKCGLGIIDKKRERPNESSVNHIIGDVANKHCVIIDDIVDTGGSLVNSAQALVEHGAKSVRAAITHPVLSLDAAQKIEKSALLELIVSDSIPLRPDAQKIDKIKQVSVAPLLAESILRIHNKLSVSSLFE